MRSSHVDRMKGKSGFACCLFLKASMNALYFGFKLCFFSGWNRSPAGNFHAISCHRTREKLESRARAPAPCTHLPGWHHHRSGISWFNFISFIAWILNISKNKCNPAWWSNRNRVCVWCSSPLRPNGQFSWRSDLRRFPLPGASRRHGQSLVRDAHLQSHFLDFSVHRIWYPS